MARSTDEPSSPTGHLLAAVLLVPTLAIAAPLPPASQAKTGHAIQPPGQFHAGEAVARDGERWLALRMDAGAAALVPAMVRVETVADPLVDEAGQRTGQAVATEPADDAIRMLLRGPALVAGPLEQAVTEQAILEPSGPGLADHSHRIDQVLSFRDARYRLWSECTPRDGPPVHGQPRFDCRIVLGAADGRTQELVRMDGYADAPGDAPRLGADAMPELLVAGDLDRDGVLDLLLDTTDHYNLSRPTLFLSSQAGPGEFLRQVARFEAVGC